MTVTTLSKCLLSKMSCQLQKTSTTLKQCKSYTMARKQQQLATSSNDAFAIDVTQRRFLEAMNLALTLPVSIIACPHSLAMRI